MERLKLTFRFTYAFHAREVRFECDRGEGFVRLFPETFSFHAGRRDPAELLIQLQDLRDRPALLSPRARRRDTELLMSRLVLGIPRYLERLQARLEGDQRLEPQRLDAIHQDVALTSQIFGRFAGEPAEEDRGLRTASLHLRKILHQALLRLVERRVEPDYLEAFVAGDVDPVDPADDLSETGFFITMETGDPAAVNRCLVRLAERAFYRWLEDVCLDEGNDVFDTEDSPFESREAEVFRAISSRPLEPHRDVLRSSDLSPFLRRPGNRDCLRLLGRLEAWFLRQYDVHHAAAVIQHAHDMSRGVVAPDRVLSRHRTRNYLAVLAALASPFLAAALFYERAPRFFDTLCALELALACAAALWFLLYSFLWRRDLTFFHASVPRIMAGIIVGYLPIFFIDEVWSLANRGGFTLFSIVVMLGSTTLLYLYIEVQRRLGDTAVAFARARQIFLLGVLQSTGIGLLFTGLIGPFMATRNWLPEESVASMAELDPFIGQLPAVVGIDPLLTFPSAIFVMTFMSFFIGTFLQLMWEDLPITEPL